MTQVDAEANFTPAEETNPVTRLRDRAAMAREDHQRRMARGSDFVIAVVRPKWVIVLGWTAKTQRKADHWAYACNIAFAFLLLLASAFIARGVAGKSPLMVLAAWVAPLLMLKMIRVQLTPPFGETSTTKEDKGYEVS
jgi:fatty acid desaturase